MDRPKSFPASPKDLANEVRAITRAASVLRCDGYCHLPPRYPIDFALEKARQIVFWAEVKSRTCARETYPDFFVSVGKVEALKSLQEATGIPALLVVGWTDCLGILNLPCAGSFVAVGGRRDRGGANDIEPMVHFSVDAFRRLPWE